MAQETTLSNTPSGILKTILLTGLLVGTLDAIAAIIVSQTAPLPLFRFIASGVFGNEAFAGGLLMAFWGLLFHYIIAYSWTTLFFLLYPKVRLLSKNRIVTGAVFGFIIWLVMNLVVLPMTNVPVRGEISFERMARGSLILILMIGIPASFIAYRFYFGKRRTN